MILLPLLALLAFSHAEIIITNPIIVQDYDMGANSSAVDWPNLPPNRVVAARTQRDVAANVSLAMQSFRGVDLQSVFFEPKNYNQSSFDTMQTLFDVGFNAFVLDLYYNNYTSTWGLCPESVINSANVTGVCDPHIFNLENFSQQLNQYVMRTNNALQTGPILILLKLHQFYYNSTDFSTNSTLISNVIVQNVIQPYTIDNQQLPTLANLLLKMQKRVLIVVIEASDWLLENWVPEPSLFYSTDLEPSWGNQITMSEANFISIDYFTQSSLQCNSEINKSNTSSIQLTYDSSSDPFTPESFWSALICGYSPIINHPINDAKDLAPYVDVSLWSWAPFQPSASKSDLLASGSFTGLLTSYSKKRDLASNENTTAHQASITSNAQQDQFINRCAVVTKAGWVATSCLNKFHSLCRDKSNKTDIRLTSEKSDYINAPDKCGDIGDGDFVIFTPTTPVEQLVAMERIPPGEPALWIDLNSLSSENCWVVGIYTNCPYQVVISKRVFAEMIIPSSIMASVLFLMIFAFQFDRQPVLNNRRSWRKAYMAIEDPDGKPI